MPPRGPQPGDVIGGRYRLEVLIGTGGMGAVWSAKEDARDVAVKFLHARMAADPMIVQRFVLEAKAGAKIEHPNVVRILDSGREPYGDDSVPFLVMELLSGQTLADALRGRPKLAAAEAGALVADVASGAAAAHRAGIVHRDLKPANVFLHHDGNGAVVPKILDFGISKFTDPGLDGGLTTTGAVLGSTTYMSPEQATGAKDVDARSDVWSLGVLLYRLLTGDSPLPSAQSDAMLALVGAEELPLESLQHASIPPPLAEVVRRCLKKRREDRFVNGVELEAAIRAAVPTGAASDLTLIDGPPPLVSGWVDAAPSPPSPPRRSPVLVIGGIAAAVVLALGALLAILLVPGRSVPAGSTSTSTSTVTASSTPAPDPPPPASVEPAPPASIEPPPPHVQAHASPVTRATKPKPSAPKSSPPAASAPPVWRTPGF